MDPVTLTSERLLLRPFTAADTEPVFRACQDPDIQRWTIVPSPYRREDAESFTGQVVPDGWRAGTSLAFAVLARADARLIGAISVFQRGQAGTWEIGYWMAKEHRGNGYMAEAVTVLTHWSLTKLGAERLEWRAEVGNAASRAVAEKAGFRVEGLLRADLLNKGTRRDCWLGAILPSDLGLPTEHAYLPAGQ
ncbi:MULTISPECIES: GNAT family N-acetyltransferase [unclassified Streptomyces]|uniref:GNAT family N-acetyltransferase n=1 Tax=unclassified Streptomyces TaxID=2593676 RepID=UPI002E1103D6|nr:GNAT family N-acetyltransferase [Streptomyces sp. NBC_01197]WSS49539.1 GNAT family N-acetyltransferase [Streptomyces sp. NBC_01180]